MNKKLIDDKNNLFTLYISFIAILESSLIIFLPNLNNKNPYNFYTNSLIILSLISFLIILSEIIIIKMSDNNKFINNHKKLFLSIYISLMVIILIAAGYIVFKYLI